MLISANNKTGHFVTATPDMNILLVSFEGLNDWIEPLGGHNDAKTPNMNRLAKRGFVFDAAFAASPAGSPSKTATLFGQPPWETGVYSEKHKWHDFHTPGERKSLIGRLRDQGYDTHGAGRIFQNLDRDFDARDWTCFNHEKIGGFAPISATARSKKLGRLADFGPVGDGDEQYDDRNTDWLSGEIKAGATGQLWALGLHRPHLPFIAPQVFFDLFGGEISDPPGLGQSPFDPWNTGLHKGLSPAALDFANASKMLARQLHKHGEYSDFLRAYLASIAYGDDLLGQVLDRIEATGLADSTLIALWSDHGWQFGEKLAFRSFSLWERALRVPLILAGPGIIPGRSAEPVSLIDLAPTVMARAGLPVPARFSGQDLSPLLEGKPGPLRGHAVSVWGRNLGSDSPDIALSVRSKTHRYTVYWDGSAELYDHRVDPFEHKNLIFERGTVPRAEVEQLRFVLQQHLNFDRAAPVESLPPAGVFGEH